MTTPRLSNSAITALTAHADAAAAAVAVCQATEKASRAATAYAVETGNISSMEGLEADALRANSYHARKIASDLARHSLELLDAAAVDAAAIGAIGNGDAATIRAFAQVARQDFLNYCSWNAIKAGAASAATAIRVARVA
jgi:hypothetical protein